MRVTPALLLVLVACTEANDRISHADPDTGSAADATQGADLAPAAADAAPAPTSDAAPEPPTGDAAPVADLDAAADDATTLPKPDGAVAPPEPDVPAGAPRMSFVIRTSTAPFPHEDTLAGQTAWP